MTSDSRVDAGAPSIDTSTAHAARVYDYLLGGRCNFEIDRETAKRSSEAMGGEEEGRLICRINRDFVHRAVRWLAREAGMRQFLDVGTGIPNEDMLHRVALDEAPDARVVYVDHDPLVLSYAHLLTESQYTLYIDGDFNRPDALIGEAGELLDFSRPVVVMLAAVLHLVPDEENPYEVVRRLVDRVAVGSYLLISHQGLDLAPEALTALKESTEGVRTDYRFAPREHAAVARFFDGLELVAPGLVPADEWAPGAPRPSEHRGRPGAALWAGIGQKVGPPSPPVPG